MKNRYFTYTLILLVTCGILIKSDSQIQTEPPKLKVGVHVTCDGNLVHQSQVEGIIKRELRSFEDVQIVAGNMQNPLWDFLIYVHILEIRVLHNDLIGYATSVNFYVKVPIKDFIPDEKAFYRRNPAVLLPINYIGYYDRSNLEKLGEFVVAEFDKKWLQRARDRRIQNSR